jgi:tetratricopeptide (TPR) repeat protein
MIGEIYLINREADKAVKYLQQAWDLLPASREYMTRYAIALVREHKPTEALELVHKAETSNASNRDVFDNIGMVFLLTGRLYEAKEYFQKAYELLPTYGYFQKHISWVEKEIQDYELRKAQGKKYTSLYLRQKGTKLFFNEDK